MLSTLYIRPWSSRRTTVQNPPAEIQLFGPTAAITFFSIPIKIRCFFASSTTQLRSSPLAFPDRHNFCILMAVESLKNLTPFRLNFIRSSTFPFQPLIVLFITLLSLLVVTSIPETSDQIYSIQVVNEFRHDPAAFTQGLLYGGNDTLFESTGLNGQSSVRKVNLQTAKIEAMHKMDDIYFGEGLTLLGERLYQLMWLTNTGFIYDRDNLSKFKTFRHPMHDGWGFATDGKTLFGSDGSSSLYQINPHTMEGLYYYIGFLIVCFDYSLFSFDDEVMEKHAIKYKNREVYNLNELEYINNEVWANIWQSDCIVRISPSDGTVTGWILLPELREGLVRAGYRIDVLNGIAWDADENRIFVTGKLWPKVYQIELHPHEKPLQVPIEKMCMNHDG